jgi:hypothetical protein
MYPHPEQQLKKKRSISGRFEGENRGQTMVFLSFLHAPGNVLCESVTFMIPASAK